MRLTPDSYLGKPGQYMVVSELSPGRAMVLKQELPNGSIISLPELPSALHHRSAEQRAIPPPEGGSARGERRARRNLGSPRWGVGTAPIHLAPNVASHPKRSLK